MYNKSFIRNTVLVGALVACAIILPAQNPRGSEEVLQKLDNGNAAFDQEKEALPPPDNTEGLAALDKIIARYEGGNLYLSGEILFYENADSASVPQERNLFTSITTEGASSYEIDSIQTIMNAEMTLMVDKKEKSMAIAEHETEADAPVIKQDIGTELKQFRDYIYSVTVQEKGADQVLIIQFKDDAPANTSSYEIVFEPSTYRVKQVRIEVTDGEIIDSAEGQHEEDELVFVDAGHNEIPTGYFANIKTSVYEVIYRTERKADPALLDIHRFVEKGKDGYTPSGSFKNYELLN